MEDNELLVLESYERIDPVRVIATAPNFAASAGDLCETADSGLCFVVYRFASYTGDMYAALSDAYDVDHIVTIYRKEWEATG